jgi:hypothetical protein
MIAIARDQTPHSRGGKSDVFNVDMYAHVP